MLSLRRLMLAAVLAALGALPLHALAQGDAWPTRPIRLVIAYPPGGSTDIAGRLLLLHGPAGTAGIEGISR